MGVVSWCIRWIGGGFIAVCVALVVGLGVYHAGVQVAHWGGFAAYLVSDSETDDSQAQRPSLEMDTEHFNRDRYTKLAAEMNLDYNKIYFRPEWMETLRVNDIGVGRPGTAWTDLNCSHGKRTDHYCQVPEQDHFWISTYYKDQDKTVLYAVINASYVPDRQFKIMKIAEGRVENLHKR